MSGTSTDETPDDFPNLRTDQLFEGRAFTLERQFDFVDIAAFVAAVPGFVNYPHGQIAAHECLVVVERKGIKLHFNGKMKAYSWNELIVGAGLAQ